MPLCSTIRERDRREGRSHPPKAAPWTNTSLRLRHRAGYAALEIGYGAPPQWRYQNLEPMMHGMQALTRSPVTAATIVAVGGAATILGAYFFQYVMGLRPCPLCLDQRIAFYVSIPLAIVVIYLAGSNAPRRFVAAGLGLIAVAMLFNAGLALFHAGVEWKWWPGPQECSGPLDDLTKGGDLLSTLTNLTIVRCDEAQWRFLGLSLAGYNVLISLALSVIAAWGVAAAWRQPR
jgi:disulfide bond formation protein DsbB